MSIDADFDWGTQVNSVARSHVNIEEFKDAGLDY